MPDNIIAYWLSKKLISVLAHEKSFEELGTTREGMTTAGNDQFLRYSWEVNDNTIYLNRNDHGKLKWFLYQKGGEKRRWYGNNELVVNWENDGSEIKNNKDGRTGRIRSHNYNGKFALKEGITWTAFSSASISARYSNNDFFDSRGPKYFLNEHNRGKLKYLLGLLNSKISKVYLEAFSPAIDIKPGHVSNLPVIESNSASQISEWVLKALDVSTKEWDSKEISFDFLRSELIKNKGNDLEESYDLYRHYWNNKFFELHRNEEELNRLFIEIYGLEEELTPEVPLEDITILKEETSIENGKLVFHADEAFAQLISYAVGCMFGRYSLDKEGLILANQGESLQDYLEKITDSDSKIQHLEDLSFLPDDDNIIPVLDDEWFEDDIVARFHAFLKASLGTQYFEKNLAFVEECIGMDLRRYFVREFYKDHVKRYKTRPIYWMFSSAKGSFNVLIYMHRYTPDTLNQILNGYLREYQEKLKAHMEQLDHVITSGSSREQTKAAKEKDKLKGVLLELQEYERDILYPLATERVAINLDDGVLVNYNKFGKALKEVSGLNDKKAKEKVREFDWIDVSEIK